MFRRLCGYATPSVLALGVLALAALPTCSQAAWLRLRNDGNAAVVVQRACLVRGQLRWGKPFVLYPAEVSWESIAKPGIKRIVIFDVKRRQLYKGTMSCGDKDRFYSIRFIRRRQVDLVPDNPPSSNKR